MVTDLFKGITFNKNYNGLTDQLCGNSNQLKITNHCETCKKIHPDTELVPINNGQHSFHRY